MNPNRLDLTTLRIFVAVASHQNLTRAAEQEHLAPSAVSKRLSDLEEELGAKLFYRMPRGVELTPAGQAMLHHAGVIFRSIEQLSGELSDYAIGVRGHVRIMVNASAIVQFVPADIKVFLTQYPEVKIDLREGVSTAVVKAVADSHVDIGIFVAGSANVDGLQTFDYQADKLSLIAHNDHPLASKSEVRLNDILPHDFIGLDSQTALENLLSTVAKEANGSLHVRFRVTSFDAVLRMVAANIGVGIGPLGMISGATDGAVKAVPLNEEWATRQLKLVVRNFDTLPAPAKLMVNHLRKRSQSS